MWVISGIPSGSENSWIRDGAGKMGIDIDGQKVKYLEMGFFYHLHVDDSCPNISLLADPSSSYIQYTLKSH